MNNCGRTQVYEDQCKNSTASLEPTTHAADFAARVRMNQVKRTAELRHTTISPSAFGAVIEAVAA
jgi:hypothetical protein